ncbi:PREDICTED: elongation factor 1-gamma-like [Galeopterus variegatus]|uniref:Elongation factor 1-gamma-like n=1 Tax=Galeopterus variegatus TaxID=482537 RepID=A0ABM0S6B2_GALVR|nr:PREDICTED: elongation factor 1-gamma-like [Galeopterus variegatus]
MISSQRDEIKTENASLESHSQISEEIKSQDSVQKSGAFLQYSGAQGHILPTPPHFHFGQTNCPHEFLGKFPVGKFPAFEGNNGCCVFESNAIASYESNEELHGSTPEAAAQVEQWVSFADSDTVPPASMWVFPTLDIMHHNTQATENAEEEVRRILGWLDAHFAWEEAFQHVGKPFNLGKIFK